MDVAIETFLVTVYTRVDDLYHQHPAPHQPRRRGCKARVSDSEILTLLLAGQWLGTSERGLLRQAHTYWRSYFPVLPSQRSFNRRARDLGSTCAALLALLARALGAPSSCFQVVASVPVPLAKRCRGQHHRLFGLEAGLGRGGRDKHFYYGDTALLAATAAGVRTGFVLGPANTEDRWLLDALLSWRADPEQALWQAEDVPTPRKRAHGYVGPTGPRWWPGSVGDYSRGPYITDAGFSGAAWLAHWQRDCGALVLPPTIYGDQPPAAVRRSQHGWRQISDTVNAGLTSALQLAFPGAKTAWGLVPRRTATCVAFNLGIGLKRHCGRPDLAIDSLFPA